MTDYNDGKWHGWNGGECPVHPKSELEAVCVSTMPGGYGRVTWKHAGDMTWDSETSAIVAFRVVKQHRDPRQVFLEADAYGNWVVSDPLSIRAIKFREVIE